MALFTYQNKVAEKRIHEGSIINLRVDTLKMGDKEVTREVVEHNGGVVILCQPQHDQVVLIKQYRYSVDQDLLEFPAGRIEAGEDPLLAAKRELTEETGCVAGNWLALARLFTAPGFCNEILHLYLATEVELSEKDLDDDEETDVIVASLEEAWKLVMQEEIQDAKTVAGLGLLIARANERSGRI